MGVREHHVGNVTGCEAVRLQLFRKFTADAECTHIHEHVASMPAQQRDGAPAQAAMANGTARKALNKHVYFVHLGLPAIKELQCGEGTAIQVKYMRLPKP